MTTVKKSPTKPRHDLYIRLEDKELKVRAQKLSDRMGFNSVNRVSEVALKIGVSVMERPEYWSARLDGVLDGTMAEFIVTGLKEREKKRKADKKK